MRTRGRRSVYFDRPSTSYSDSLAFQQVDNILTQNVMLDENNLQGIFPKLDGFIIPLCGLTTETEEEIAVCGAKVDEINIQRLLSVFPQFKRQNISQMYELCEKNLIRTIDNINFYKHMNLAIQNAFRKLRSTAIISCKPNYATLKDYESFANEFVNSSQENVENAASECPEEPVAGPSHFEC